MIRPALNLRQIVTLLSAVAVAATVGGCGRTLVFVERDGVNLAVRANTSSTPPIEANFGLNRTIATIVPPAGENGGRPDGDSVNMFAGFDVNNTLDPTKAPLNANLTIDTQFASGQAAVAVAKKPQVVAQIVNMRQLTFSSSDSSKQLKAWLMPNGPDGDVSQNRLDKLQAWLNQNYPSPDTDPAAAILDGANNEPIRKAALANKKLMAEAK